MDAKVYKMRDEYGNKTDYPVEVKTKLDCL
jgi:hypothetical protein